MNNLKYFLLLHLTIAMTNLFAVSVKDVYMAPYGVNVGQYGYNDGHSMDEDYSVPRSYSYAEEWILVDDIHNERLQQYKRGSEEHSIIHRKQSVDLKMVNSRDSVIWGRSSLFRIKSDQSLITIATYGRRKNEVFAALFPLPSGIKVLVTNYARYLFSAKYELLPEGMLPSAITMDDVICFDNCTIVQSNCFSCLHKHYLDQDSSRQSERRSPYSFPDSSEWGIHFDGFEENALKYIGDDKNYISYWSCATNRKNEKGSYRKAVFAYNSIGTLLYWFVEPKPRNGWSFSTDWVRVSQEGAITKMVFYTKYVDFHKRIPKSEIDTTKGIRIVEYIPDEIDKSHEGRVKRYGQGRK